jgi:hypothetical protein
MVRLLLSRLSDGSRPFLLRMKSATRPTSGVMSVEIDKPVTADEPAQHIPSPLALVTVIEGTGVEALLLVRRGVSNSYLPPSSTSTRSYRSGAMRVSLKGEADHLALSGSK